MGLFLRLDIRRAKAGGNRVVRCIDIQHLPPVHVTGDNAECPFRQTPGFRQQFDYCRVRLAAFRRSRDADFQIDLAGGIGLYRANRVTARAR